MSVSLPYLVTFFSIAININIFFFNANKLCGNWLTIRVAQIWSCPESGGEDDVVSRFSLTNDELELMAKVVENGFYPFTEPLRDRIRLLPFVELKKGRSASIRRCTRCIPAHYKPDRTHHCSKTDAYGCNSFLVTVFLILRSVARNLRYRLFLLFERGLITLTVY